MSSERIINKRNGNQFYSGSIGRTWSYGGNAIGERSKLWQRLDNAPERLILSDIEKDLQKMLLHFQETATTEGKDESHVTAIQTELDAIIAALNKDSNISLEIASQLQAWIKKYVRRLYDGLASTT